MSQRTAAIVIDNFLEENKWNFVQENNNQYLNNKQSSSSAKKADGGALENRTASQCHFLTTSIQNCRFYKGKFFKT